MLGLPWITLTLLRLRQKQYSTQTKIVLAMFKSVGASLVRKFMLFI